MTTLTPLESRLRCILQEKFNTNSAEEARDLAAQAGRAQDYCVRNNLDRTYFANSQRDLETLAFLIEKEKQE